MVNVLASLLAADFGRLADEARRAVDSGCDALHLDVMDGQFVPNLSMGPAVVAAVNRAVDLFLDVHLMIYNPYDYIERFVEAGADRIIFHLEATENVEEVLDYIHRCNVKAGLAVCPETSEELVFRYLEKCDLVLMMTVHPGFGGQSFIPEVLGKIEHLRSEWKGEIQVDGGINQETAEKAYQSGATDFVTGTYLFEGSDMKEKVEKLHQMVTA